MPLTIIVLALASAAPAAGNAVQCHGATLGAATDRYAALIQAMDADAIGAQYLPDGAVGAPDGSSIVGPAAISKMVGALTGFHVTSEAMTITGVQPVAAGWAVSGRFAQTGTQPNQAPYAVSGTYRAEWRCVPEAGWRLARMDVNPAH